MPTVTPAPPEPPRARPQEAPKAPPRETPRAQAQEAPRTPPREAPRAQQQETPRTPPPELAKPLDTEPQSTSATFGDWVLRCNRMNIAAQFQRVCEVAQTIVVQGQRTPVAEVAIGRIKKADPLRITIILPVNVSFPSAPRIFSEAKDTAGIELTWRRCLHNGCFADALPKDEIIHGWRGSKAAGRIETKDAFGRNVTVAISFRGLAQALDALAKEPF